MRKSLADAPALKGVRISTGIDGLDRVFGADWRTGASGIHVPSVTLLAGAAGTGKSTLLLRMSARIKLKPKRKIQYVTSEQTLSEIRENAERIGLQRSEIENIEAEEAKELEDVLKAMRRVNPQVAIVDSLNELIDTKNDTADAQANSIRTITAFKEEAEKRDRAIILITHMNKKEEIAGVQRLQHIVSVVMKIEKDPKKAGRVFVGCPGKNRFGSTTQRAWFTMTEHGLIDALDPEKEVEEEKERPLNRF